MESKHHIKKIKSRTGIHDLNGKLQKVNYNTNLKNAAKKPHNYSRLHAR